MPDNDIGWGQGAVNNDIGWGKAQSNNTIGFGAIYENSPSGDTNLIGGTPTPPVPEGIANNYSMNFDGSNYINIGVSDVLNFTPRVDAFSVSVWIKKVGSGSFGGTIYSYNADSGPRQIQLTYDGSSQTLYAIIGGSNSTASANLTDGNWHHLVFVIPAATTGVLFYHNGSLITTTSSSIGTSTGTVGGNIGSRTNGSFNFNGSIDEIGIWNTELTSTQVQSIYDATGTNLTKDLTEISGSNLVYWNRMGD